MSKIKKEERPWGRFFIINETDKYKLKRIEVEPNQRLSYQYHRYRSEVWTIIEGKGTLNLNGILSTISEGETILIPQGSKHRIENKYKEKLVFIELQTGSYFGEDDIIRIEDDYNR